MAECTALLRRRTFTGTGGSNPPLSASFSLGPLPLADPARRLETRMQKPASIVTGPGLTGPGLTGSGLTGPGLTLILALAVSSACTGPQLRIENPGDHHVFVDGQRTAAESLPFRYYGTSRWATLPRIPEVNGVPEFDRNPHSETVEIAPPSSAWLFPLDFPLEAMHWMFFGQGDQSVTVSAPKKSAEQRVGQQIAGEKLSQLSARARQARITR